MKVTNQVVTKITNRTGKILKSGIKNSELYQRAKRVLPYAAISAATVLTYYGVNKTKPTEEELIIDESFLDVLSQDLAVHNYTNKEDLYYLASCFESAPAFIADLIMMKDDKNNLRTIKKSSVMPLMEAYEINPKYTEELINEKNEEGEFRYSAEEIKILANLSATMPEVLTTAASNPTRTADLLEQENEVGNKLYSLKNIQDLFNLEKTEPEETEYYMNMKKYETKEPRFTVSQVKLILKRKKEFPELVNALVEAKGYNNKIFRFEPQLLMEILQLMNKDNAQIIENLEKQKTTYSINSDEFNDFRYRPEEIISLIKKRKESELDLLIYCAENYYFIPKLKNLLKDLNIKTISEETYKSLKEYRTDGYNGWRQVKKPIDYKIMNVFKELLESNNTNNQSVP